MGCFGTMSKPFRRLQRWYRKRKERKMEKKRKREERALEAMIAEVVSVQGEVKDVQAEVSAHSSLASTTLDIIADPSLSETEESSHSSLGDPSVSVHQKTIADDDLLSSSGSSSSSSDGEGVPLGDKSGSNDVGGSSGLSFPMSLVSDLGPSCYSLRKFTSEPTGICSRPREIEEARQAALHHRVTESLIVAVYRKILPTIPEADDDLITDDHVRSPRSPERSISSLPPVSDERASWKRGNDSGLVKEYPTSFERN